MVDLSNATFIIPLRIESSDRMRNIITLLCFLFGNFNTNVIIKEVDSEPVFVESVLPQVKEFLGKDINLTHIFEQSDDPVFYRMHILNEMLYAVELMEDNHKELCDRLGVSTTHPHYVCADALDYHYAFNGRSSEPITLDNF